MRLNAMQNYIYHISHTIYIYIHKEIKRDALQIHVNKMSQTKS